MATEIIRTLQVPIYIPVYNIALNSKRVIHCKQTVEYTVVHDYVYLILYAKIILTKHSHDYMSTVSMLPVSTCQQ